MPIPLRFVRLSAEQDTTLRELELNPLINDLLPATQLDRGGLVQAQRFPDAKALLQITSPSYVRPSESGLMP